MTHVQLRQLFTKFWRAKNHREVPPIPLVPRDDPTTLFTGSGMQQLIPYLLGEPHSLGKRLYNIQPCFRSQDIEEVGNNRHTTFFEMLGNWSLGDYFKKEQLEWFWIFLTKELRLPKEKLSVTIFEGFKEIPADEESYLIWKKLGIPEKRIYRYGPEKNWWSRSGTPEQMPAGEPGGPDSEVFYEFTQVKHNNNYGNYCHPNCDCGRFLEIGNSVFMEYKKNSDCTFSELPKKNVDFGGGLERTLAAVNNDPDVFRIDVFKNIIAEIENNSNKVYEKENKSKMQIIADHMKGAVFMANEGVEPSNKEQGYVMRRLIRRAVVQMMELGSSAEKLTPKLCQTIINSYKDIYFTENKFLKILLLISQEVNTFLRTVDKGVKLLQTTSQIDGKLLFDLKQSYGFPVEIALELLEKWGKSINKQEVLKQYQGEFKRHQERSRATSAVRFKGGLADQSAQTIKYHTATHLLHQALFDILGNEVRQEGSNITSERLRFDFHSSKKPSQEEIKKIENIINQKINESLTVNFKIIPKDEALKIGARAFFKEKYPDLVKVYFIGSTGSPQEAYSKEFCGGPHVKNTAEIGKITIFKFEKIGSNLYRIYTK